MYSLSVLLWTIFISSVIYTTTNLFITPEDESKLIKDELPRITKLIKDIFSRFNLPTPKLYVQESETKLNCSVSGITKDKLSIRMTKGFITALSINEIKAILYHEINHIIHRDLLIMMIRSIFSVPAKLVTIWYILSGLVSCCITLFTHNEFNGIEWASNSLILITIQCLIYLLSCYWSRRVEYRSDHFVKYTARTQDFISALTKLELYDPEQKNKIRILSNYPSFQERIKRLSE